MVTPTDIVLALSFGLLGIAVLSWIVVIARELLSSNQFLKTLASLIFLPAPATKEVGQSSFLVRILVGRLIPIIFWLLILVPMIVFPIILIIFPLFRIPWTYLLPPVP